MAEDDYEIRPLVFDNGSGFIKAGFGGHESPSLVFRNVVGRPRDRSVKACMIEKDSLVGEEAQCKGAILNLNYPINRGEVKNWVDMEEIWYHTFKMLRVDPEKHPVVVTDATFNPRKHREKMTQIFFETFKTPAMYVSNQAILSLYTYGQTTGLVLDCGDGVSQTVPVFEGHVVPEGIQRQYLAGRDVTEELMKKLTQRGYHFTSYAEREIVENIKEKLAYVVPDYEEQLTSEEMSSKSYELPDGEVITIGTELFSCSELLFRPELIRRMDAVGLHEFTNRSIKQCDVDVRHDLYKNIFLAGGSTLLPGFAARMQDEITTLAPRMKIKVVDSPHKKYSAWFGGSVFSSLSTFRKDCISKKEYEESGARIVHKKCYM